ncbi:hypothetical protein RND81_13G124900 [Saponaria officinalis]|uniref:Alpha-L-fucosidase n=1 Tax=Saponaria officinalis TaxID=3572 RepID=A0AAW1GX41_SAPOF
MPHLVAKLWWVLLANIIVLGKLAISGRLECDFPAIYNFGDSNSDTGGISAAFLPLPWPNGQNFLKKPSGRYSDDRLILDLIDIGGIYVAYQSLSWPNGETSFKNSFGRYSDGRLIVDFFAEKLGIPYLSAYLNSLGANYSHGTNFATGGSTIRQPNETIFENGISPFSLDIQIAQYDQFKSRSKDLYGNPMIRSMLPKEEVFSKALYTFDIGQNDLGVAFRTMNNDDQIRADIPNIIDQFSSAVQNLYKKGARFFWIHNTGPIGCIPDSTGSITPQPGTLDQYGCIKSQNDIANEFNKQLSDAVLKLGTELPKAALTYVDVYTAKYGLISQAANLGWEDPTKLCCGYLEKDGRVWCGRKGLVNNGSVVYGGACSQPERYVSWDGIHYTEAANHWFANLIINGSLSDPPNPITYACYRD